MAYFKSAIFSLGIFAAVILGTCPSVWAGAGVINTVVGNGVGGFGGDGARATLAQLYSPNGAAVDGAGNIFIADQQNHRIRRVDVNTGFITTVVGNGTAGFSGDGGLATSAKLYQPEGVALNSAGDIYIADYVNQRVRRVDHATGIITTIAGNGTAGEGGDAGQATSATLSAPAAVAIDSSGNIFIAEITNIRKVNNTTGIITTVAGTGLSGYSGDGGLATNAKLFTPNGVVVDAAGNIFIGDSNNNRVRKVDGVTGIITTFAGTGARGYAGDGGLATQAKFFYPQGIYIDSSGNLFIADTDNNAVRRVDAGTGIISTVAGNGTAGYLGDGGLATSAKLHLPYDVVGDASGNLFITDSANQRVREVSPTYTLTVLNGTGSGDYVAGSIVSIAANAAPATQVFANWSGAPVVNPNSPITTLTMLAAATTVTANYQTPTLPTVAITSPTNNAVVSGTITISGTASDLISVASVTVAIDSGTYTPTTGITDWTYTLNTTLLNDGLHRIIVKAVNGYGGYSIATASITIHNISTPLSGPGTTDSGSTSTLYFLPFSNFINLSKKQVMNMRFQSGSNPTDLMIYSRQGTKVRQLDITNGDSASWDGKDDSGKFVATGIYTVILKSNGIMVKKKIVVVK